MAEVSNTKNMLQSHNNLDSKQLIHKKDDWKQNFIVNTDNNEPSKLSKSNMITSESEIKLMHDQEEQLKDDIVNTDNEKLSNLSTPNMITNESDIKFMKPQEEKLKDDPTSDQPEDTGLLSQQDKKVQKQPGRIERYWKNFSDWWASTPVGKWCSSTAAKISDWLSTPSGSPLQIEKTARDDLSERIENFCARNADCEGSEFRKLLDELCIICKQPLTRAQKSTLKKSEPYLLLQQQCRNINQDELKRTLYKDEKVLLLVMSRFEKVAAKEARKWKLTEEGVFNENNNTMQTSTDNKIIKNLYEVDSGIEDSTVSDIDSDEESMDGGVKILDEVMKSRIDDLRNKKMNRDEIVNFALEIYEKDLEIFENCIQGNKSYMEVKDYFIEELDRLQVLTTTVRNSKFFVSKSDYNNIERMANSGIDDHIYKKFESLNQDLRNDNNTIELN